jgi:hypothetical protein
VTGQASEPVIGRGRPLRFLALVCVGWVGVRIAVLWTQTGSLPEAIRAFVPLSIASLPPIEAPAPVVRTASPVRAAPVAVPADRAPQPYRADPLRVRMALMNLLQFGAAEYSEAPATYSAAAVPVPAQQWLPPMESRWSGSAWLLARGGSGAAIAPGGQIGGSQAGVRIGYTLDRERRIGLFARFTTPLQARGREAAIGAEWQPTRAPVRLVAEQRLALDGGHGGPGLGVVAGDDRGVAGFRLETYGQAGAIRRDRIEPYADGAARATRTLPGTRIALGVGAWGAAQRDAARFDVGPSATLALPVAGQNIRVALDWRQRIAGSARPGSGLALTLGSDF